MSILLRQMALVSLSPRVKIGDVMKVAAALQKQASRDIGPIWEVNATVDAVEKLEDVPPGYWPIIVADNINQPRALGYHTDRNGQPFAMVMADDSLDRWSLTASHELAEMLVDPFGNRLVAGDSAIKNQGRVQFLVEVADPSEDAAFAYKVNGILVTDFYTPQFFDPVFTTGTRYSFRGVIEKPRSVLKGGYLSWLHAESGDWWQEVWFGTPQSTFRNIGPLNAVNGSLRSQIDRVTTPETTQSATPSLTAAFVTDVDADRVEKASTSMAAIWHAQIATLNSPDGGGGMGPAGGDQGRREPTGYNPKN